MSDLSYLRFALVSPITTEFWPTLQHANPESRIYSLLHSYIDENGLQGSQTEEERSILFNYIMRDVQVPMALKDTISANGNNEQAIGMAVVDNAEYARAIIKSTHNCYYDYLESTKYILNPVQAVVPYPLSSDKQIDFDYYIILEYDYDQMLEEAQTFSAYERVLAEEVITRVKALVNRLGNNTNVIRIPLDNTDFSIANQKNIFLNYEEGTHSIVTIMDHIGRVVQEFKGLNDA